MKNEIAARARAFFVKERVGLNNNTSMLKLIAIITMFIDHIGAALLPGYHVLRVVGRIAFPIYAYCIAAGCVYTKNIAKYISRLTLLALISQPIYVVALNHTNGMMYTYKFVEAPLKAIFNFYVYSWKDPSILLTLIVGAIIIWAIREKKVPVIILMLVLAYIYDSYIDYGVKGVILIVLLYLFIDRWYISLPVVAAFIVYMAWGGTRYYIASYGFQTEIFALMALPFIYLPLKKNFKLNKYLFYAFYPAHLLIIYLLEMFM